MSWIAESPPPLLTAPLLTAPPGAAVASPVARAVTPLALGLAAAGPIGIGGVLAARLGDAAPLVAVPAAVFAVTALTLPALYIATAVVGAAPPIGTVVRAVGRALHALGLAHLGLALPLWFLAATASPTTAFTLGALALATGAGVGLRALHAALFDGAPAVTGRGLLFVTWAMIALVIGARLFSELTAAVAL